MLYMLLILLLSSHSVFAMQPEAATAIMTPAISYQQGEGPQQLMWLTDDEGNTIDGPFQGPAAIISAPSGNHVIADTLNARVVFLASSGEFDRTVDLSQLAQQAGLENSPMVVDISMPDSSTLLAADAANNAVIKINLANLSSIAFSPNQDPTKAWKQINHIHSDKAGNIFIEDISTQKTVMLDKNGNFVKALKGMTDIAVGDDSRVAMLIFDFNNPNNRAVYVAPTPGADLKLLAQIKADNPIVWTYVAGFDAANNLHLVYDTTLLRHYIELNPSGQQVRHRSVIKYQTGYDVNRAHWVDHSGEVYTLRAQYPEFQLLKLH